MMKSASAAFAAKKNDTESDLKLRFTIPIVKTSAMRRPNDNGKGYSDEYYNRDVFVLAACDPDDIQFAIQNADNPLWTDVHIKDIGVYTVCFEFEVFQDHYAKALSERSAYSTVDDNIRKQALEGRPNWRPR